MRWFRVNQGRRSFVTAQPRGYAVNWWLIKKRRGVQTLNAPSNLTITDYTASSVDLSWTDNSGNETGFVIQRKVDEGAWSDLDTVAANTTIYTDIL